MEAPQKLESTGESRIAELQDELYSLRTLLSVSLVLMIVFSLCVDRYLFKQVAGTRSQIAALKISRDRFSQPKMQEFWATFMNYAKSHPDYVPVIAKFNDPNVISQTILTQNPAPTKR